MINARVHDDYSPEWQVFKLIRRFFLKKKVIVYDNYYIFIIYNANDLDCCGRDDKEY